MKQRYLIAVIFSLVVAMLFTTWYVERVNQTHPAAWPMVQGDSLGRYATRAVFPAEPVLLWSVPVDDPHPFPPVIGTDGTVYLHTPTQVLAVGADGQRKWAWKSERELGMLALGRHGDLYVVRREELVALDPQGRVRWRFPVPEPGVQAPPIVGQAGVIYLSTVRGLLAVTSDGKLKWEYARGRVTSWPVETPSGNVLVLAGGELLALKPDGEQAWSVRLSGPLGSTSPAVAPDGTIYLLTRDRLYAYDAQGQLKASAPAPSRPGYNLAVGEGVVQSGLVRWKSDTALEWEISATPSERLAYLDARGNVLLASVTPANDSFRLSLWGSDGARRWQLDDLVVRSLPAIGADGRICFAGQRPGEQNALICLGEKSR